MYPLHFFALAVWGLFRMGILSWYLSSGRSFYRVPPAAAPLAQDGGCLVVWFRLLPLSSPQHIIICWQKSILSFTVCLPWFIGSFKTKWSVNAVDVLHQQAANLFYDLGHVTPSLRFLSGEFHPGWLISTRRIAGSLQLMQLLLCHCCSLSCWKGDKTDKSRRQECGFSRSLLNSFQYMLQSPPCSRTHKALMCKRVKV